MQVASKMGWRKCRLKFTVPLSSALCKAQVGWLSFPGRHSCHVAEGDCCFRALSGRVVMCDRLEIGLVNLID